jgi:DNA-binding CsgD family transcriptional regulator
MTTSHAHSAPKDAAQFRDLFRATAEREGWRAAAPLIEQHWDRLALSEPATLLAVIKTLPSDAFIDNPAWLIGVNYLKHLVAGSDPRSFRQDFNPSTEMPSARLGLREKLIGQTGRIADLRTTGRVTEAVKAAVQSRRILLEAGKNELATMGSALPHLTIQWARAMDLGDNPMAFEVYEDTYDRSLLTNQPRVARRAAASLAWMYADQGHTGEARRWLARANQFDVETDRYDIPLFLTAALLAADMLEPETARAQLAAAKDFPVGEYWAAQLWIQALLCARPDDMVLVESTMMKEIYRHPEGLASTGANRRYLTLTRSALRLRPELECTAELDRIETQDVLAAEDAYRQGAFGEAVRRSSSLLGEDTTPRLRAAALLTTAASRYRLGRSDSGVDAFRRAHALIEHENLLSSFGTIDGADLRELSAVSERALRPSVLSSLDQYRDTPRIAISSLTPRELEVLRLLTTGMSNAEIAEALFITLNTLKSTVRHVYSKLGVHDRQKACDVAHQLNIGDMPN